MRLKEGCEYQDNGADSISLSLSLPASYLLTIRALLACAEASTPPSPWATQTLKFTPPLPCVGNLELSKAHSSKLGVGLYIRCCAYCQDSPSLISLMVSVDVEHHDYLLPRLPDLPFYMVAFLVLSTSFHSVLLRPKVTLFINNESHFLLLI